MSKVEKIQLQRCLERKVFTKEEAFFLSANIDSLGGIINTIESIKANISDSKANKVIVDGIDLNRQKRLCIDIFDKIKSIEINSADINWVE